VLLQNDECWKQEVLCIPCFIILNKSLVLFYLIVHGNILSFIFYFLFFSGLVDHMHRYHADHKPWACFLCPVRTAFVKTLYRHLKQVLYCKYLLKHSIFCLWKVLEAELGTSDKSSDNRLSISGRPSFFLSNSNKD
jgi:hypothetical protein